MMRNGFFAIGGLCQHMGWGGGIFMVIGGIILLALLIYGIVLLTRQKQTGQPVTNHVIQQDIGSAFTILNERYARGEINEEEYTRKKTELRR